MAEQVIERQPGYRLALHAQQVILCSLATLAYNELNPREALRMGLREVQVADAVLKLDPNNTVSMNNLASARGDVVGALWAAGRSSSAAAASAAASGPVSRGGLLKRWSRSTQT